MYYSIYNDNKINTNTFYTENLIKLVHFPSTVRTPPNRLKNYFIGELTKKIKPQFDSIITTSSITLPKNKTFHNFRYNNSSHKIKQKKFNFKSDNFPLLIHRSLPNKSINGWSNTKNIKIVKNDYKNKYDLYYKEIIFPYNKPKILNPNIINYNKSMIYKNPSFNTIKNNRKKRLFLKSFTRLHLLIDKSCNEKKVSE